MRTREFELGLGWARGGSTEADFLIRATVARRATAEEQQQQGEEQQRENSRRSSIKETNQKGYDKTYNYESG